MPLTRTKSAWLLLSILALFLLSACDAIKTNSQAETAAGGTIQIVAAENFYGDIAKQVGGKHVTVTSILSDPNIDPHTYESNVNQVKAIAKAQLVISNGGGYDDWMNKLLDSTPNSGRKELKGFDIAKVQLPDNEHVWYSPENAKTIAATIAANLKTIDAANATDYATNLTTFQREVGMIEQKMTEIKSKYANTPIGLTETIFLYQTGPMQLQVLTPPEFQKAMAEGNDPPANTVVTTENQINQQQIKVLIYNEQTQSAITTKLQSDAKKLHIAIVPVTETMPSSKTYQTWMLGQLEMLEQGLSSSK